MEEAPSPARGRRRWIWWIIAFVWWTLDGFTDATNYHRMGQAAGRAIPWEQALRTSLVSAWLWIPLTVLALWLAERFPLDARSLRRYLPVHVVAAVGVCLFRALAVVVLNPWIAWYPRLPPFGEILLTSFANNLFLFWMMIGVGHALVYARRYRERDQQLARAELDALKMQLHPHFLFNALNTVVSFVHADPDKAERMIARLSELLRHSLAGAGIHEVPLAEELEVARSYLEIEQARFEDRLRVRWRIDPAVHGARVPHLILQPLIENAVRHGIGPRASAGTIEIEAEAREGALHLAVRDDGVGTASAGGKGGGVGLANTRARLRQLYGARQDLRISSAPGGGFEVAMRIPLRGERPLSRAARDHASDL